MYIYFILHLHTIWYPDNCPSVRVRVWVRVRVSFRVGRQFSSGAIVLESYNTYI